jgi:hypothetical protein
LPTASRRDGPAGTFRVPGVRARVRW